MHSKKSTAKNFCICSVMPIIKGVYTSVGSKMVLVYEYISYTPLAKNQAKTKCIVPPIIKRWHCCTTSHISYNLPAFASSTYFFNVFLLISYLFIKSTCFIVLSFKNNCISAFNSSDILSSLPTGLPLFLSLAFITGLY